MVRFFGATLVWILLYLTALPVYAAEEPAMRFDGVISRNIQIEMALTRRGDRLEGEYMYKKIGRPIKLVGRIDPEGRADLNEFDPDGKHTGRFSGRLGSGGFSGQWSTPEGNKRLPFKLSPVILTQYDAETAKEHDLLDEFRGQVVQAEAPYRFKIYGKRMEEGEPANVTRMEIFKGVGAEPFQVIKGLDTATPLRDYQGFFEEHEVGVVIEDMNFDGYGDLRIIEFVPVMMNTSYLFWLFNPQKGRFEPRPDMALLSAPVFDHEKKRIYSNTRNPDGLETRTFEFKDGKLKLIGVERE